MSITDRLFAAASPRLAVWLSGVVSGPVVSHSRREVVEIRIASAEQRLRSRSSILFKAADAWLEAAENQQGSRMDWALIGHAELQYLIDDLKDRHGERMTRLGLSDAAMLDLLHVWAAEKAEAAPDGISIWTDAPKDYDHGYTFRTKETYTPRILGKPLTRVIIPSGSVSYQVNRYMSGGHAAFDEARVKQERAYDEKAARKDTWADAVKSIRETLATAADLVPAAKTDGHWSLGGRTDWSTHRPVELPPSDPRRARTMLLDAQRAFYALPKEARDDEWKLGSDIDEILPVARRAIDRLEQQEATASQEAKHRQKLIDAVRDAEKPGFVLVGMRAVSKGYNAGYSSVPERVYGRVLAWPKGKYDHIQVEVGHAKLDDTLKAMPDPCYPPGTPAAVWGVGAPITVKAIDFNGRRIFGWKTGEHYGAKVKVVDAEGRTMGVNTKAYQAFVGADDGSLATQDRMLDDGLAALIAKGFTAGWNVTPVQFPGSSETALVEFKPPSSKGRGTEGWQVRKRMLRRPEESPGQYGISVGYLLLERAGKMHAKDRNYWRNVLADSEPVHAIPEFDNYFRGYSTLDEQRVRAEWLAADPRRTLRDARERDWEKA